MSKFIPKMSDQKEAIERLSKVGVPVIERDYGFRVALPSGGETESAFIECGTEHNGSISLSMPNPAARRAEWFFRFNFIEAAELIVDSFVGLNSSFSAQEIVQSMKSNDEKYDYDQLEKLLAQQEVDFQKYIQESE